MDAVAERELPVGDVVIVDGKAYVIYKDEVRSGGSSSWRAKNPGNMDYTEDQARWGACKDKSLPWGAHRFSIFPTEDKGLEAVGQFLRAHQTTRSIKLMQHLFAPAGDLGNDPDAYANAIAAAINADPATPPNKKVTAETLVKDLSNDQIKAYAKAIKKLEGWDNDIETRDIRKLNDATLPQAVKDRIAGKVSR
jgi:hypothetical protein